MSVNIFLPPGRTAPEDLYTHRWHYLLARVPGLGQAVVDCLLGSAGRPGATFIEAQDHPAICQSEQPDFLVRCEQLDIIFEHKLRSPLGSRQLERYLALPHDRPYLLALVAGAVLPVAAEALEHPRYLRPADGRAHFRWEDLYPVVEQSEHFLAQEFAAYMVDEGLKPWHPEVYRDLFVSATEAEAFAQHAWRRIRSRFTKPGTACRLDAIDTKEVLNTPGLQIRNPAPGLPLLYLKLDPLWRAPGSTARSPALYAHAWVSAELPPLSALQQPGQLPWAGAQPIARAPGSGKPQRWRRSGGDLREELVYHVPLEEVLRPGVDVSTMLESFASTILDEVTHHLPSTAEAADPALLA